MFKNIPLLVFISILFYSVAGVVFWASFDNEKGTLLKQLRNENKILPTLLMLTWPIFALKYLYLKFFK